MSEISLSGFFLDQCSKGLRCPDKHCGLFHPFGWNWRRNVICPEKDKCRKWGCQYWHQHGHVPIDRVDCPDGEMCSHRFCSKKHPFGWNWLKNTECTSVICYDKSCPCMHNSGQKECMCHYCNQVKEPGIRMQGNNYCSQECYNILLKIQIEQNRRYRAHRHWDPDRHRYYDDDDFEAYG